ncbi:hypothetical protein AX14_007074 [Amanita brunnescens Koide BX004]|nr:hypothetical protein AX14_007074 [Amanita brunnescens Koide BX004]
MAKRRVVDDDDDQSAPTYVSKRARTQSNSAHASSSRDDEATMVDDVEVEEVAESSDAGEPNGAPAATEEDQEAEEKKFEQEHGDKIRQSLDAKRNHQGGIADHGILESIEMNHFMCHKWLKFNFGPQINFIIGYNGSGKSAVLSAITIALGGKANATGRGSGLKSFIKEGQSVAEVTVTIKNQGEEAYKPDEYGKSIVITRRFTKDGSTSWKIKNKDGKVISTKREELSAICDHMNIQVDNPLNVLTQDSARQFLSSSHPSDKYKFFLKGTQLAQLSEEYDICLENISQTSKILASKREALPDLRSALREAIARYEEAAKAREQKKRVDELKKELAWSLVKTKEVELNEKLDDLAKANRKIPKIENQLADARVAFEDASNEVASLEEDYRALGNMDDLSKHKEALQSTIRENRNQMQAFNSDLRKMDDDLCQYNEQIAQYDRDIAAEEQRAEKHTSGKREQTRRKLEEAKERLNAAENEKSKLAAEYRELEEANIAVKNIGMEEDRKIKELKSQVVRFQEIIEQCKRKENDKFIPYGNNIKTALDRIGRMKWSGEVPLGPLGLYVNAKEPAKWGNVLRYYLGQYLTAFAITDARDRPILKKLLAELGNPNTLIVIYEKDMFDYSRGELPPETLTVHRALDISDPFVIRILINLSSIERIVLSETRRDGDNSLRRLGGGTAWTSDGFLVRVYPDGGVSSTKQDNMGRTNALLLTGKNTAEEIRHYTNEMRKVEADLAVAMTSMTEKRQEFNQRQAQIEEIRRKLQSTEENMRAARYNRDSLQQELTDDLPGNISGLVSAKEDAEQNKESIKTQAQEIMIRKTAIGERNRELVMEQNEVSKKLDDFYGQQQAIKTSTEDAAAKRVVQQNNILHFETKLESEMRVVRVAEQAVELVQQEFTNWRKSALEFCEPFENPRKKDVVERNIESVQRALAERERRHGASVEDMTVEVNRAKAKLEVVQNELKQMYSLNKALKKSLTARLARWQEFRRHIALRCKLVFQYNLSHRGYFGKILFNHVNQTLHLKASNRIDRMIVSLT